MYYLGIRYKKNKKQKTVNKVHSIQLVVLNKGKRKIIDKLGVIYYEKFNQYMHINIKKLLKWLDKHIKIHKKVEWLLFFLYSGF